MTKGMTKREMMIKALNNESVPEILFSPRLEVWYYYHNKMGTLPEEFKGNTLREIENKLGLVHPGIKGEVLKKSFSKNIEVRVEENKKTLMYIYETPYGELSETYALLDHLEKKPHVFKERLWKKPEDYKALECLIENTVYTPNFETFKEYDKWVGEDGVPFATLGCYDPFYELIRNYIGFEVAYLEIKYNRRQFLSLFNIFKQKYSELQDIALKSPADFITHGAHYDSKMTPPHIFKEYISPYLSDFATRLHERNKKIAIHLDADVSLLLQEIAATSVDITECFTTYPLVDVKLEKAMEVWKNKIIIWGGIPSSVFIPESYSESEFIDYINGVFKLIKEYDYKGLILGVADNFMPQADIDRIRIIMKMIENHKSC